MDNDDLILHGVSGNIDEVRDGPDTPLSVGEKECERLVNMVESAFWTTWYEREAEERYLEDQEA